MVVLGTIWFQFAAPWLLTAGVLGFIPLILGWRRQSSTISLVLRFCVVVLGVTALANPMLRTNTPKPWVILRDVSPSVGNQGAVQLELADNGAGVFEYHFAENLQVPGQPQKSIANETKLAPSMQMARALAIEDKVSAAVLLSDGRFHDNWKPVAQKFAETKPKIPLFIIPLNTPPHDTAISSFTVARDKNDAKNCTLTINVQSNVLCVRTLTVTRTQPAKVTLYKQSLRIFPGRPTTIRLTDSPDVGVSASWAAQLTPADELTPNDTAVVSLLPHDEQTVGFVAAAKGYIKIPGYVVREVSPDSNINWKDFAAIILTGDMDTLLNESQQKSLEQYVRSGGGVVMIGVPSSKNNTPLNRIAALVGNPFERNPLSVTIILDASGSMARSGGDNQTRFDLATEGVMSLKAHLTKHDRLRVLIFNSDAKTIYDSGAKPIDFSTLRDALSEVIPNGPTKIASALAAATKSPPPKKTTPLLLVLSDLQTEKFSPTTITKRLHKNRWKLGVVAISGPLESSTDLAPNNLEALGNLMKAPIIHSKNLDGIGTIFAELCDSNRNSPLLHGNFKIRSGHIYPNLASMTAQTYTPSAPIRHSHVIASVGEADDPLLAWKTVGLGKCFSLAAPLNRRDNPQWFRNPEKKRLAALLRKLLSRVVAPKNDERFDVTTFRDGNDLKILVRVAAPGQRNNLKLEGLCFRIAPDTSNDANWRVLKPLKQIASGTYEAVFHNVPAGGLGVGVFIAAEGSRKDFSKKLWSGMVHQTAPPEFSNTPTGANFESLRELAAITGGQIISLEELPKIGKQTDSNEFAPVWGYFLGAAILLMLLEWGITTLIAHRKSSSNIERI